MSCGDQKREKEAREAEGGAARFEQELAAFFGLMAGGSQEPVLQKLAESMQKAFDKAKEREDGDL
jgi:DNA-binding FadR family transcriptional regulator